MVTSEDQRKTVDYDKIELARFYGEVCLISRSKTNKFCWSLTREGNVLLLLNWCCSKLLRRM